MPHSYLSVPALKSSITIGVADVADDARLRAVLEAVSQQIDDECERTFRVYLATLYPRMSSGRLLLDQDLLAVTSLKTDDGDRTYPTTWATTDYDLEPADAPMRRAPYWEIQTTPSGAYTFPSVWSGRRGVQIVGKWGYWEDLVSAGTIAAAVADATTTSVTMTAGHGLEAVQTILVDSEQLYVTAVATNTLTVERGVNGTTAASHLILAPVLRYRYPAPIVEATRIQAARVFQRVHAPFGVTGSAELGTTAVISRVDPDVKMLIQHYKSGVGMVA